MKRAIVCMLALTLFAFCPVAARAAESVPDTQTEAVDVAVEGDASFDDSKQGAPSGKGGDASTGGSDAGSSPAPATGDSALPLAAAALAAGGAALVAFGAAGRLGSERKA